MASFSTIVAIPAVKRMIFSDARRMKVVSALVTIFVGPREQLPELTDYRQLTEPSASRTPTVMTTISASSTIRTIIVTPDPLCVPRGSPDT
jgi:hypothetical protein